MKLNHINLPVKDVTAAREFFETYFAFRSVDVKLNDTLSVLKGTDGFTLVLMSEKLNQNGNNTYPDAFHIGFFQQTEAEVLAIFELLKSGGIHLEKEPQLIRKTFGFYFHYQGILIEIATEG
ncbi:MAG: glyoxalase/bleomycin resistance/extradiol dioxygenase family protein [Mucilaginibacter sp.]|nr:glyoxalase/bleomycin resistance/extradiol dioxygenase family protein [Mucilaginibacter sp.]